MIYKNLINYLFQNLEISIDRNFNYLKENKLLFNAPIKFSLLNKKLSSYDFSTNNINIPKNFFKNQQNYQQFISIEKYFGDKALEFIIKHEVGHLCNHQFLSLDFNKYSENFEYITLKSKSNYIKTNTSLDSLLNRISSYNSLIDDFIHMNFTESYSDAYAGITSYLQDKDISIFDKIYKFRFDNLNKLKNINGFNPKVNNSHLEISTGKFATSRYHTYTTSTSIKNNIINIFEEKTLENISFNNLHSLIQIEVLHSLKDSLLNEIQNNVLFNNDFKSFLQNKNLSIKNFFQQYDDGLLEYKNNTLKSIIHEKFFLSESNQINQLIDFHSNNTSFTQFSNDFLDFEKEQSLFLTISRLNNEDKLEKNRENLNKFIIKELILPNDEFSLFMNYLSSNNKNNSKFDLIEKSLEPTFIQSLIKYNNINVSSHNVPVLNNHSYSDLINIITKDLSPKDKKEFINYINKNNIAEITTANLSDSNFNVSNNNNSENRFELKSKSEILSRTINISHSDKKHHTNDHSKLKI